MYYEAEPIILSSTPPAGLTGSLRKIDRQLRSRRIHCNQEVGKSNCQLWSYGDIVSQSKLLFSVKKYLSLGVY